MSQEQEITVKEFFKWMFLCIGIIFGPLLSTLFVATFLLPKDSPISQPLVSIGLAGGFITMIILGRYSVMKAVKNDQWE